MNTFTPNLRYSLGLTALSLCLSLPLMAQHLIGGQVLDAKTQNPIAAAVVQLIPGGSGTVTDLQGHFQLRCSHPESCRFMVHCLGYRTDTLQGSASGLLVVQLEPSPIRFQTLQVRDLSHSNIFSTLSHLDLRLRPARSSQDLLRLVPGLFIAQHMGGGKAEQIFLRGFDADHGTDVALSVDGMPVNMVSHIHGQGYADLHFLIPELVATYQYGKGPYYPDQGDFNTAGYVAFHTLNTLPENTLKVEAGEFQTYRGLAMVNLLGPKARASGQHAYLAAELAYKNGPFQLPEDFLHDNVFAKYDGRLGERQYLTFELSQYASRWSASGEIPLRLVESGALSPFGAVDSTQGGRTHRSNAILKLSSTLSKGVDLDNEVYASSYGFHIRYDNSFLAQDSVNGDVIQQDEPRRTLYGYEGRISREQYLGSAVWNALVGWSLRADRITGAGLYHPLKDGSLDTTSYGNLNQTNLALYTSEQLDYRRWHLDLGLRYDQFRFHYLNRLGASSQPLGQGIFSPKLDLQYRLSRNLQLYVKTGKGFHSNDARVVLAQKGYQVLPAAYGTDLGLTWKPTPKMLVNGALWYLYLQQEFVYSQEDGSIVPGGRTERRGLDLSVRYQWTSWLYGTLDLNLAHPRELDASKGANYLPLAPLFSSTGGVFVKRDRGFSGGLSYRWLGRRPANETYSLVAQGYMLLDFSGSYRWKREELGLSVENLLNSSWREFQEEMITRLPGETQAYDGISFTPGTPFMATLKFSYFF